MNSLFSLGKSRYVMFKLSFNNITKKISLSKKRDMGIQKLKKEIENNYSDKKDQLYHSIKNQSENLNIKSKIDEVGEEFDGEAKTEIKELGFDFSKFKKRNEKLDKTSQVKTEEKKENSFNLKKEKGNKEDKDDQEDLKKMLDEDTFEKLEEMIIIDKSTEKMIGKTFDVNDDRGVLTKVTIDPQQVVEDNRSLSENVTTLDEENENISRNVLVHRPERKHLWGLGEEVKNKKRKKFTIGMFPTVEEIVSYLEMYNLQDILIVSRRELGLTHLYDIGIICSGFNAKHLYKSAKDLILEVKKLDLQGLAEIPNISGRKDEEWLTIQIGDITVHFFTEQYRKEVDLIGKWTRKDDPEFLNLRTRFNLQIKEKKNSKF